MGSVAGIKISNSRNVTIRGVSISNSDVGVEVVNSDVNVEGLSFNNVRIPWLTDGTSSGRVRGTRIRNDPKLRREDVRTSGWSRPKGAPLPLMCPNCQTVSASKNYVFGGMYWTLWNNNEECPQCGYPSAKLAEGFFDLSNELAKIISAPDLTHDLIYILQIEIKSSFSKIPFNLIEDVTSINSSIGAWLRKAAVAIGFGGAIGLLSLSLDAASYLKDSDDTHYAAMQSIEARQTHLLEKILGELGNRTAEAVASKEAKKGDRVEQHSGGPTEAQTIDKSVSTKFTASPKPKSREIQRKAKADARRELNPRARTK